MQKLLYFIHAEKTEKEIEMKQNEVYGINRWDHSEEHRESDLHLL